MSDPMLGYFSFAVIAAAGAFWVRSMQQVSIPKNRGGFVAAAIIAAVLAGGSLMGSPGWLAGSLAALAVFFAGFFLLTIAIGAQRVNDDAIAVGDQLPAFAALTDTGERFDSAALAGAPALIKFFRGHW